ncbi:hypothetical protein [Goodfellowiella coeruleoviolacea]|uniref:Uncharacterized protein n=1 Tax=Goodfellowiella coeruleoviolacea TaxID=334858 RepID=A0AAE3KIN7_9PSEU|nr:hypothetical protein [Goodfellowiella coeruleoviolacea]MCP2163463.1 hypothetical protein [Goodfellowiella coeruleoviolacea]
MANESAPKAPIDQEVQQYAEQVKEDLSPTTGGFLGGILDGIGDISNKITAVAAAARAGQFAVSPDKAEAMTKELNNTLDTIDQMRSQVEVISRETPLGRGYAEQIGSTNASVGQTAADVLVEFAQRVATLRDSVRQSVANYRRVDDENAGGLEA